MARLNRRFAVAVRGSNFPPMSVRIRWWISFRSSGRFADGLETAWRENVRSDIDIDLAGNAGGRLRANREELLRLFENLIENALKYGASGGKVIVSLTSATSGEGAPEVRVMVRDFGPGIAAGTSAAADRTVFTGSTSATAAPREETGPRFIAGETYC